MENIYLVIRECGDFESSYTTVCSAWKTISLAEQEKKELEADVSLIEKIDQYNFNFCDKCPINDYNLPMESMEKLAKEYCERFCKSDCSPEDEIFCENQYQSEFLDEWVHFSVQEIQLNE